MVVSLFLDDSGLDSFGLLLSSDCRIYVLLNVSGFYREIIYLTFLFIHIEDSLVIVGLEIFIIT